MASETLPEIARRPIPQSLVPALANCGTSAAGVAQTVCARYCRAGRAKRCAGESSAGFASALMTSKAAREITGGDGKCIAQKRPTSRDWHRTAIGIELCSDAAKSLIDGAREPAKLEEGMEPNFAASYMRAP